MRTKKKDSPEEFRSPKAKPEKNKAGNLLFALIIIILTCVLLFSGYKLFTILNDYITARKQYSAANSQYVSTELKPGESSGETEVVEKEKFPITVDFDSLRTESKDIVGWLYSPDTIISYPVVQCADNDYYLHRFMDGSYSPGGTLFVDSRCQYGFAGENSIIYGHNMNDGSMFASLTKYRQQDYFDKHPTMYLATPDGNYRVDIFSAYITPADSYTYKYTFESASHFGGYLNQISVWSEIETGITPTENDRILTFSTCTYEFEDARFVVHGVLVPMD